MSDAQIFTADAVWCGVAGSRIPDGAVVVSANAIAWVGPRSELPEQHRNAPSQHFPGGTLLPGLVESHAHLSYDGREGTKARSFARSAPNLVAVMIASARELLSVGVTTVRDLGARDNLSIEVREAVDEGLVRGPRILVAGAQITTTGGHTWQNHGRADSPDDVRKLVRSHHKSGVDLIKVNATGGFMTARSMPWRAQFSDEEMTAIVEETHRLGKKVAAHAHGVEGIERAVAAGVDTIEHCTFVAEGGVVAPDLALIDEIAARGIHVCATATWNLPAMMRRNPDFRPPVRLMHERGVKLIAGNDSGIDGVPHADYVGGLETSVILGIPIEDVLVGATSRAAEALGLTGGVGELAPGAPADIIAVRGDPLDDVSALRDLLMVMARGRTFAPDEVHVDRTDPEYAEALRRQRASEGVAA
ncbi:Imidazolonepropionase [Microbacterium lemovicicum]|uniref:Imidazolonepropionase n=1 Tax=Microbacterium lemovicicum TaxID=1072463 RepID=A0A3S9W711_9MICO|nr:amidohydrolase family protein [Microbacterium lemovicicum]AZS35789.1 Imidazolonepropionase [Microbacterium lemovicicum]